MLKLPRCLISVFTLISVSVVTNLVAQNPVALPEAVVTSGNARFTVLTPEMVRIEYSDKGVFEDRATFAIQNREMESVPVFETAEDSEFLYIKTSKLNLKYRKGTNPKTIPASADNLSISMAHNGQNVLWYPGKPDPLNLKGTCRTLDGSNGDNKRSELENGLISRSGWAVIDDSWTAARPDGSRSFALEHNSEVGYDWWAERKDPHALDLYFMGYGSEYKKAIGDFTKVAGKIPLPPNYVFGYWYSRYASYSSDDYRQIMTDLETNDIPTDVMILDMDWHWNGDAACGSAGIGGWTGWSWNTNLIPEPVKLLNEIHDRKFKVSLNLHPADGVNKVESPKYFSAMDKELGGKYTNGNDIAWSIDYPDFTKSFFKNIIREHESEGVDFWWLDWQQHLESHNTPGLGETFWCNHVFFNDMKINRPSRRPVIFHRWGGLGSHRYQIGFSGDALINFPTLAFQPYFTATASNVGYAYWGHDLGGHAFTDEKIVNDPELMLRWMQFGVFTPIFRSHATKDTRIERRIWKFSNFPQLRDAVKLRYALFPYIYTMARKTYDTGIGICRPLYYEYPNAEEAYKYEGEYFFGDDILVAPITEHTADGKTVSKKIWFPEGKWWSVSDNCMIEGPCEMTMTYGLDDIPYFFRSGSVIPFNPSSVKNVTEVPSEIILNVVAGESGDGFLYEDAGDNSDYAEKYATTAFHHTVSGNVETCVIEPRQGIQVGLCQNRAWSVNLLNAKEPESVKIDGKPVDSSAYYYDASTNTLNVKVPNTDCGKSVTVTVVFKENGGVASLGSNPVVFSFDRVSGALEADLGNERKNVDFSIHNLSGMECLHRSFSNVSSFSENLSHLESAMYICCIKADDLMKIGKIIK